MGFTWKSIDTFLGNIGCMSTRHSHKWAKEFLENGIRCFEDERGGNRKAELYDLIPELELEAKFFVVQECEKKAASFKISDLANSKKSFNTSP